MKILKSCFVIIIWGFCFILTTVFLTAEFILSLVKFKLLGVKSERYFKPRPIFPNGKNEEMVNQ